MLLLTSTSDLIQVITASAVANTDMHASYTDYNGTTVTPARTNLSISTGATTTLVASPGSSTQRNVKAMIVRNTNASSSNVVTVQHFDGTTTATLVKCTLLAGESLQYFDKDGWVVMDASGGRKVAASTGRLVKVSVVNQGTTSFTTGPSTNTIKVRLQAAGGGGGGCSSVGSAAGAAGGGSAGGYAEKLFGVSPNTAYTCSVGAGGTGASAAIGNAGGDTTFVVGATTVTAKGGLGGPFLASSTTLIATAGAASPAVSTNGDLNVGGAEGGPGVVLIVATPILVSGDGGSSRLGSGGTGRTSAGTGNAAGAGYGGGGGGAATGASAAQTGGAGADGVIIVEEYS